MSTLGQKQEKFSTNLGKLLIFANGNGLGIRMGECFRTDEQALIYALTNPKKVLLVNALKGLGFTELAAAINNNTGTGIVKTLHGLKLAVDLNVFRNGDWAEKFDYMMLARYWKTLDPENRWGGDFSKADIYHFSIEHEGIK